jgi:site-specific DNA recombinase
MIAAIYARKSTEQNVSDDAKSVTRQVELARTFAERQGWAVPDEHVYCDDGVSGAEFEDRPGLAKLVLASKSKPRAFDVIVTMDQDRVGRDQIRTPMILNDLIERGVRVFYYASGQELKLDTPTDRLLANVVNFGNEWYRHQVRIKTREAMRAKAANGYVAGGKVFGYTNVRDGAHVTRVVNEAEAKVILRIFELAASGLGLLRIAKTLNEEGALSPESRHGTRDGWATTSVREMLRRDLYRGRVVYRKTRWTDRGGTKVKVDVPEPEWRGSVAPQERIDP